MATKTSKKPIEDPIDLKLAEEANNVASSQLGFNSILKPAVDGFKNALNSVPKLGTANKNSSNNITNLPVNTNSTNTANKSPNTNTSTVTSVSNTLEKIDPTQYASKYSSGDVEMPDLSYETPDLGTYTPGTYTKSDSVLAAEEAKNKAAGEFTYSDEYNNLMAQYQELYGNKPSDYVYDNQEQLNDYLNRILNREDFSYDLNGDMLYQQYKDSYMNQGQQAMMDTIGQASAMTGGYGNSYAQSVGQQTYQGYLQQLNDKIPELYNLALQKYQMDSDKLNDAYNLLSNERSFDYGQYQDNLSQWNKDIERTYGMANDQRNYERGAYESDRDYTANDYYKLSEQEYSQWSDAEQREFNAYVTNTDNTKWATEFEFDNKKFQETVREWVAEYGLERDKFNAELEQWANEYNLKVDEIEQAKYEFEKNYNLAVDEFNETKRANKVSESQNAAKIAENERANKESEKLAREKFEYEKTQDSKNIQAQTDAAVDEAVGLALENNKNGTLTTADFMANVLDPTELSKRGMKATVNGQEQTFNSYGEYLDTVAENWQEQGYLGSYQLEDLWNSEWWRNRYK